MEEGEIQAADSDALSADSDLSGLEVKVGESPCPHLFPSFVLNFHLLVFPSVAPLRASALFHFRLALEEPACPIHYVFVVFDLFVVHVCLHRFQCHDPIGSCAGHHHGDVGTDLAIEAQGQDAQADLEGPAVHLLVACVVVVPPFSEG